MIPCWGQGLTGGAKKVGRGVRTRTFRIPLLTEEKSRRRVREENHQEKKGYIGKLLWIRISLCKHPSHLPGSPPGSSLKGHDRLTSGGRIGGEAREGSETKKAVIRGLEHRFWPSNKFRRATIPGAEYKIARAGKDFRRWSYTTLLAWEKTASKGFRGERIKKLEASTSSRGECPKESRREGKFGGRRREDLMDD